MTAPTISELPTAPQRSDPPATFVSRADAFVAALATFRTEANAVGEFVEGIAEDVATVLGSAGFSGTSTTNLAIGTGSKTLTTQTGRGFAPPAFIIVASAASPSTHYMFGLVTAYDPTTGSLTFTSIEAVGTGSRSDWQIALSGPLGPAGNPFATPTRLTANYSALPGDDLECDTTGGAFTVTLPAGPSAGATVVVSDGGASSVSLGFGADALTVARNGSTINGQAEDITITTTGAAVRFTYSNSTWRVRLG
jgi:hypothetical protein